MSKIDDAIKTISDYIRFEGNFDRMKNCVNCDHSEVCLVVARRKAVKANDYTPCSHWKMVEHDEQ